LKFGEGLTCTCGCSECCVDDITVFEIEAENIKKNHKTLLQNGSPHPHGMCAFLDSKGACRIYDDRPYVCRTQGLPLRWMDELIDGTIVEMRDICPLNDKNIPIEELEAENCWTIGNIEGALADLQSKADNGQLKRVALRALFI
jgi:Fe-S-cluster containining protein